MYEIVLVRKKIGVIQAQDEKLYHISNDTLKSEK